MSGPYGLFDVIIDRATILGLYGLNFSILEGTDANASDTIGTAVFSVTVGFQPYPGARYPMVANGRRDWRRIDRWVTASRQLLGRRTVSARSMHSHAKPDELMFAHADSPRCCNVNDHFQQIE